MKFIDLLSFDCKFMYAREVSDCLNNELCGWYKRRARLVVGSIGKGVVAVIAVLFTIIGPVVAVEDAPVLYTHATVKNYNKDNYWSSFLSASGSLEIVVIYDRQTTSLVKNNEPYEVLIAEDKIDTLRSVVGSGVFRLDLGSHPDAEPPLMRLYFSETSLRDGSGANEEYWDLVMKSHFRSGGMVRLEDASLLAHEAWGLEFRMAFVDRFIGFCPEPSGQSDLKYILNWLCVSLTMCPEYSAVVVVDDELRVTSITLYYVYSKLSTAYGIEDILRTWGDFQNAGYSIHLPDEDAYLMQSLSVLTRVNSHREYDELEREALRRLLKNTLELDGDTGAEVLFPLIMATAKIEMQRVMGKYWPSDFKQLEQGTWRTNDDPDGVFVPRPYRIVLCKNTQELSQ